MKTNITIKADREYLREVCGEVSRNHYAIPVFQRSFQWKEKQVIDLFDSITKGYPIGSLILWKPNEYSGSVDIVTGEICYSDPAPDYYILDGRQRVTAFYNVVTGKSNLNIFNLYYNLDLRQFQYLKKMNQTVPHIVRVCDLFDTFKLLGVLEKLTAEVSDPERRTRFFTEAKNVNVKLQNYTISEVKIDQCDIEEASEVFSRINSKGTEISKADMAQALMFKKGSVPLVQVIEDIRRALAPYDYDNLSQDDILNCLINIAGLEHYDTPIEKLQKIDLVSDKEKVKRILVSVARFLREECFILSGKILPYKNQFVALTSFFRLNDSPSAKERDALRKWVLYTSVSKSFQSGSLSNVRKLFRNMKEYAEGRADKPMDLYETVELKSDMSFAMRSSSASANWLTMVLIFYYMRHSTSTDLRYIESVHFDGIRPEQYFVCLEKRDKKELAEMLLSDNPNGIQMERHCVPSEVMTSKQQFYLQRKQLILNAEHKLLMLNGISTVSESGI